MARFDFFAASLPDSWQVLGVGLRPFSLGHYIKLRRFKNAFVADQDATATLGDLLLGVAVCSMSSHPDMPRDEFYIWWNRQPGPWRKFISKLIRRESLSPAELEIHAWGKRCGTFDFPEKARMFAEYMRAHSVSPAVQFNQTSDKQSGAHWSHNICTVLVSHCGYTLEDAYNVPLNRCLGDFYAYAASEGSCSFLTEAEAEAVEAIERQYGA